MVTLEGNPWFVAADVCYVLGLKNTTNAMLALDPSEHSTLNRIKCGMRGGAAINAISESGLYKLVMRSDKPQAKVFQDWVTKDVLPAIRKDGAYIIRKEPQQLPLLDKPKGDRAGGQYLLPPQSHKRKAHRDFSRRAKGYVWEETYLRGIRWGHCADGRRSLQ